MAGLENREKMLMERNKAVNERTMALKSDFEDKMQRILRSEDGNDADERLSDPDFIDKYEENLLKEADEEPLKKPLKSEDLFSQLSKVKAKENVALIQEIEGLRAEMAKKEADLADKKAEIAAVEQELYSITGLISEKDAVITRMQAKGKGISEESKRFIKEIGVLNEKIEVLRRDKDQLAAKYEVTNGELSQFTKKKAALEAENVEISGEIAKKDEKIRQIEFELQEKKVQIREKSLYEAEKSDSQAKEIDRLGAEQKKLVRQKTELLNGFKKLRKLIESLKKQKTHLEVSGSLGFTEEEYIKALDLPEKMV